MDSVHLFIFRFCCASAVDNRTRLEFHGTQQIWDGDFIRRTIRGNSALYILTEVCYGDEKNSHKNKVHCRRSIEIINARTKCFIIRSKYMELR